MIQTFTRALALLEYGVASVTAPDQEESGDRHLVKTIPGGALVAAVDGLGHGAEAAIAARMAIAVLETYAKDIATSDSGSLVRRCHEHLKTTRGAVLSLGIINGAENTLSWLGVGNVEGVLLRSGSAPAMASEPLRLRPGILGCRLPPLQSQVLPVAPGDLVIFATDGIRSDFGCQFTLEEHPREIAEYISSNFRKGCDDGLVLVARYQGTSE